MIALELEKMVRSLSPAEKKHFRLSASGTEKEKDYLLLFDLLCKENKSLAEVESLFGKKTRAASFDNTVHYLFKVLTDQLVTVRVGQDKWYARHHAFMKARLCFERSLPGRAHHELKKTQQLALQAQDHTLYYQAVREELNYLADVGFPGMNEQEVVDLQMRSKQALKELHQIHEHHSLYELLKLRLINEQIGLERNGKMINDLVLGELGIISMGGRHLFESRKTHLLFQSFFLVHTKQYHPALNVFKALNALFEENESLWNNPPYDNLSALDGILDNLYSIGYYHEMDFFTGKLEQLMARPYPEHFRNLCYQTFCLHRLSSMAGAQAFDDALAFIRQIHDTVLLNTGFHKTDKQLQLLLFATITCFQHRQYDEANRYVSFALNGHKAMSAALAYRACRLMHILIHYETGNTAYLDYEIRAFKRFYSKHGRHYRLEKLLFRTVQLNPKMCSQPRKKAAYEKISPAIEEARENHDEKPMLKYFDFFEWISGCYTR
ncbi:hypothetical protein ACFOTA_03910 [Chitinophaga sp. GCM10012297]|uniref:Uncharacterized protein n=1 Tax=Chitinophaga chungangae TaxID=2821488 RepID=A0ABS3Y9J1_9BACT|nr:hypothetical protein [Chitinophaga chungangae]MBO9151339.1 hypothetical protein [Chitinophaga chungangae]